jgi:MFS family permease
MHWLRVLYIANGLAVGAMYGFVPVLLRGKGFDAPLIGLATALGSLAYTIALPAWGHVGDIVSGPRRTLQLACIPAAVFVLGLSMPLPPAALVVCVLVMSAGAGPALALTDAMAVPILADASREYSRLRLLTSVSAAASAVACGLLYTQTGYVVAPLLYLATMVLTIAAAQFVPMGRESERSRRALEVASAGAAGVAPPVQLERQGRFGSVGEALGGRPRLVVALLSVVLVFIGVVASGTFVGLRIADLGGGPLQVGLANGIGSIAEVPGLILAGWVAARFGLRRLLVVSATGFAACLASWVVLADAPSIFATRFVSGIFFGGIVVAFVLTMAQFLPARLQATGQTLFQAAGFGLAAIIANLLGGILYGAAGPLGVFGGAALCTLAGGAIGFLALPGRVRVTPVPIPEPGPTVH